MDRQLLHEAIPPFIVIGWRVYVVVNWDQETETVPDPNALILRRLGHDEELIYRELIENVLAEAFARTQGVRK